MGSELLIFGRLRDIAGPCLPCGQQEAALFVASVAKELGRASASLRGVESEI